MSAAFAIVAPPSLFLLKQCSSLASLRAAHALLLSSRCHDPVVLATALAARYALLGGLTDAFSLLDSTPHPDARLYTALLRPLSASSPHLALSLYRHMRIHRVCPDRYIFPLVVAACGHLSDLESGCSVHLDAKELGCDSDPFVANSLIDMYGRCRLLDTARDVFDKMPHRTVVSWTTMIGAYARFGCRVEALGLFGRLLGEGMLPTRATFLNAMPVVNVLREAEEIFALAVVNGWGSDLWVQNSAMRMFSRCGRIDFAKRLFDRMAEKDLVSWSSMIEAYGMGNMPMEALDAFKTIFCSTFRLDHVALLSIVRACAGAGSVRIARFLHGIVLKSAFAGNLMLQSALVDLYTKCGSLRMARGLFDQIKEKNVILWSTMIFGYGMHGRGREALDLYERIKASLKPDHITLTAVLSACSHSGLLDEGWEHFNSMEEDFGIVPHCAHYACVVDLLGRAGKLKEALEFIERMPIAPDASVWGSLLGACRIHLNLEIAEVAAKHLFELDPGNSGRYILLSNIYTFSGKRDDADRVRELMRRKAVKQTTAQSFIEVANKRYKFIVGDRSNPQTELIYEELERLIARIKKEGYTPNTNLVVLDIEEEAKESLLYVHSEKLAIVFGLLNLGPKSDILIHKNLRICSDCHTASKLISKVTERTIIIRDSHRFHHFNGGECSCGDYW